MMMEDEVGANGHWATQQQPNVDNMRADVLSIGPYWLRVLISEAHDQLVGVTRCIHSIEEVLKILAKGDDREVESKLLVLFQYDSLTHLYKSYLFSFVKFLLWNRLKIVCCTLLKKARLDAKKYKKIEEKMMGLGPKMVVVVHQLRAARVTPQEREYNLVKRIREMAYWLREEGAL
ncbi:hypothetical protein SO802_021248 [Lithocarpus litseifolius]|uniref:Brr2 N-terminal helicase PWI domain-containing protein n=1 Tax=Lithocarpus litseifolius TaxID=425828 RepID=A0AAW2CGC3_9ROSI